MDDNRDSPDGFDVGIPNVARVYDYYFGGTLCMTLVLHFIPDNDDPYGIVAPTAPLLIRSHYDIARFFDGLELVRQGVVFLSQWRPSSESYPEGGTRWAYSGVGRKS